MKRLRVFLSIITEFRMIVLSGTRLVALIWEKFSRLVVLTTIVVVLASIAPFAQNWAMGRFINQLVEMTGEKVGEVANFSVTWPLLYAAMIAGVCYTLANCLQFFMKTVLYKECFHQLGSLIHDKVASLDIQSHEDPKRKDLITTVLEKAMWHGPDFMQRMTYLLQNLIEVVIASMIFVYADPFAGMVIALCALPRLALEIFYNHELWKTEKSIAEVRRKFWYARYFIVDLRSLTEVKLYQNISFFVSRVGKHLGVIKEQEMKAERKNIRLQLVALAATEVVAGWILLRFVGNVIDGQMDIGTLTFYIASMVNFRFALNSLCQNVGSQFRDGKFVSDMFEAFDLKPTLPIQEFNQVPVPKQIEEIVFDNIRFTYPGTTEEILRGISLTLKRGQTFGLVAENGSGKTTLVKLLCRLYDPTSGRILVNGVDIKEFPLDEWQRTIGVLLQEYSHYDHLDVKTAIALGRDPDGVVEMTQVLRAAKAAGAHEFIMKLPLGYDTPLGRVFEGGVEPSGGQYQRLAIARVFYRNAMISIFDEPTSAVDGAAETLVFEQIFKGMSDSIKILISHRYSTLRKADMIYVLENGVVRERGSHHELMRSGGIYAVRYTEQAQSYH